MSTKSCSSSFYSSNVESCNRLEQLTLLFITDLVESVSIALPHQVYLGEVPASIALVFTAKVTSLYGSNWLGISYYSWDFGDNTTTVHSNTAAVVHTFANAGSYTVTVNVHAHFVGTSGEADTNLVVYEGKWVGSGWGPCAFLGIGGYKVV